MASLPAIDQAIAQLATSIQALYIDLSNPSARPTEQPRGPQRFLFPTSTYAANVRHPPDPVHLVCMSDDRPETFWAIVSEALDLESLTSPPIKSTLKLEKFGGTAAEVYLHHCLSPENFDLTTMDGYGIPSYRNSLPRSTRLQMAASAGRYMSPAKREERILQQAKKLESGPMGRHLALIRDSEVLTRKCEDRAGAQETYQQCVHWARASGLMGETLGYLSPETMLWMVRQALQQTSPAEDTIKSFFEYWSSKDGFVVSTPSGRNLAQHMERSCIATVQHEIIEMCNKLRTPGTRSASGSHTPTQSTEMLQRHGENAGRSFLDRHESLVKVEAEYWGHSLQDRRHFLEHELLALLRDLPSKITTATGFASRLWPIPLASTYHVGLFVHGEPISSEALRSIADSLHYDRASVLVTLTPCSSADVLTPNTPTTQTTALESQVTRSPTSVSNKFRPASSAIARLRWDPAHAGIEYEIGYEDRFEGIMWMRLEDWGRWRTEDEEFIPEHRIRRIRGGGESYGIGRGGLIALR